MRGSRGSRRGLLGGLLGSALLAGGLAGWAPGEEVVAREGVLDGRLGGRHGPNRRGRDRHRAHGDKKDKKQDRKKKKDRDGARLGSGAPCLPATTDLQAAIDGASPGATLTLCAGTWTLTRTVEITKNLTLIGAGTGQTIVDGGRQSARGGVRVLAIAHGATVTVRDLTITNGVADDPRHLGNGGGIAVGTNCTLTLQHSSVTNNAATHDGGGLYVDSNGTLTLAGSSVTGNTALYGGGIYAFFGTVNLEASSVTTTPRRLTVAGSLVGRAR